MGMSTHGIRYNMRYYTLLSYIVCYCRARNKNVVSETAVQQSLCDGYCRRAYYSAAAEYTRITHTILLC